MNKKQYHVILLMTGTNDLLHGASKEAICRNLNTLNNLVKSHAESANLINIGIPSSLMFCEGNKYSEVCNTWQHVNDMLANVKQPRQHYIQCPLEYSQTS